MQYGAPPPAQDGSSLVLCLVIFLIVLLLFRGVQNQRTCVVYAQSKLPPVSYAELPPTVRATDIGSPTTDLGSPTTDLGSPAAATYSSY
jgi:hypothetical protein